MQKILSIVSLFVLAFASAAPAKGPLIQFGEKFTLHSKILNEDRPYWVYLPSSYLPNRDHAPQKYPVLFLMDGEWNFEWASEVARFMGEAMEIPELMVVGIPNTDRDRDLTPTHATNNAASGGGALFEGFMSKELAPVLDAKWRTAPYRILVGHSLGGALAVDSFLRQTNGFQAYIAIDPSLWWDNRILVQRAKEFSPRNKALETIFIAEANWPRNLADATNSNKYASDLFLAALPTNSSSLRVGSQFFDSEDHGSSRLLGLYAGLRFVFQDYKPANFYALDEPALLQEHFKKISAQLGYQILPPERYVNKIGDALLGPEHADKAIECFKLNVSNYPDAAGVYSRLADAYLAKGAMDLAIENYHKALARNPKLASAKEALKKLQ